MYFSPFYNRDVKNFLLGALTFFGFYSILGLHDLDYYGTGGRASQLVSNDALEDTQSFTTLQQARLKKAESETLKKYLLSSSKNADSPNPEPASMHFYPCKTEQEAKWSASCYLNNTVTIGLTVWKRSSLARQLNEAAQQSLRPSKILVVQSKDFVDAKIVIEEWKNNNPDVPVDLIRVSADSGYHSRFHVAYMLSKSEYISIWDDDVIVGSDWVQESIKQSRMHNDALMGGMGRCIVSLPDERRNMSFAKQKPRRGQNDFVGHAWTLKRDHLRHYFAFIPFTYATGEDMQLAFALQRNGIESRMTQQHGRATLKDDATLRKDENASFLRKDKNLIRTLLICQIIRAGFYTLDCENCELQTADSCIKNFRSKVEEMGLGENE